MVSVVRVTIAITRKADFPPSSPTARTRWHHRRPRGLICPRIVNRRCVSILPKSELCNGVAPARDTSQGGMRNSSPALNRRRPISVCGQIAIREISAISPPARTSHRRVTSPRSLWRITKPLRIKCSPRFPPMAGKWMAGVYQQVTPFANLLRSIGIRPTALHRPRRLKARRYHVSSAKAQIPDMKIPPQQSHSF